MGKIFFFPKKKNDLENKVWWMVTMFTLLARWEDGEQAVYFRPTDVDLGSNVEFFFLNKTTTNTKQKFIKNLLISQRTL